MAWQLAIDKNDPAAADRSVGFYQSPAAYCLTYSISSFFLPEEFKIRGKDSHYISPPY
jgi:hypothetical protein